MKIHVSTAIGRGRTELSAFDAALIEAGVANFNLIRLSSVIPPSSTVERVRRSQVAECARWGDRLYAVYAEQRTSIPGEQVWAGIGWVQDPSTGRGLFVEHEGHDQNRVRTEIETSLRDLQRHRGLRETPVETAVIGTTCTGVSVCALVICAYGTSAWSETDARPQEQSADLPLSSIRPDPIESAVARC